jgi:6,7-dimethyl-8-ribityllumazine synthase
MHFAMAKGHKKFAIVVSRFNEFITHRLLQACLKELKKSGVRESDISISWVPGALELPVAALKWAQKRDVAAVIGLGAVIRGETYHFELVANEAARGLMEVSLKTGKPVIFGVLSTDTIEQANQRSRLDRGDNKGRDAAETALEMVEVLAKIK